MKFKFILPLSMTISLGLGGGLLLTPVALAEPLKSTKGVISENKAQLILDEKILGLFEVINQNEINSAKLVYKKTKNSIVKKYAKMLEHDHQSNLNQIRLLSRKLNITPLQTECSKRAQEKGKLSQKKWSTLNPDHLDQVFIKHMILGHKKVLKIIDKKLKRTNNLNIRAYLEATRIHVQSHLDKALLIQKELHY